MILKNEKGLLSFETLFFVELLVIGLFFSHIQIAQKSKKRVELLEKERLSYDGIRVWKQY